MTYIKWKDEVESYLGNLSDGERQKVLSYFAEMYADKRDAGISEEQIIEEFGAPYDVAKKIIAESKADANPQGESGSVNGTNSGGNNYNYNYYNYNYGGAPQSPPPPPQQTYAAPEKSEGDAFAKGLNMPAPAQPENKSNAGHTVLKVFLILLLIPFTLFLIGMPIGLIVDGFTGLGALLGEIAAGTTDVSLAVANIGFVIMTAAFGFILLAPFSVIVKKLWQKIKTF